MDNAKADHIGKNKNSRQRKGSETVPQDFGVRRLDAKAKGCTGNIKGQKKVRPHRHVADGLLRNTFLPKLGDFQMEHFTEISAQLESDFFKSLSGLAGHYRVEPFAQALNFGFPYNISLALWDLKIKLQKNVLNWNGVSLMQENDKFFLVSEERYDTGATLFYIPVFPVFRMLRDKKRRKSAHLILSVFSYLYLIAQIPYYCQEGSYLYYEYEMIEDWIMEDPYEEEEGEDNRLHDLHVAKWVGEKIEQKIYSRKNLDFFEHRIQQFTPKDQFDLDCLNLAKETLEIYRTYPDADIFRNASVMLGEDGEYLDDEVIPMEKYISFYADNSGWLASSVFESVNCQFQECTETQMPVISKCFDGRDTDLVNLSFENRLFELLHGITDLIYDYKNLSDET